MFGLEKKATVEKVEETDIPLVEESAEVPEDYNVDMGRRNFLRQGVSAGATAGIAALGMSPESAEAATVKADVFVHVSEEGTLSAKASGNKSTTDNLEFKRDGSTLFIQQKGGRSGGRPRCIEVHQNGSVTITGEDSFADSGDVNISIGGGGPSISSTSGPKTSKSDAQVDIFIPKGMKVCMTGVQGKFDLR